jgi:hypothetical protein
MEDGWEPTGNVGNQWWQQQFRRRTPQSGTTQEPSRLYGDRTATAVIEVIPVGTSFQILESGPTWIKVRIETGAEGYFTEASLDDAPGGKGAGQATSGGGCMLLLSTLPVFMVAAVLHAIARSSRSALTG